MIRYFSHEHRFIKECLNILSIQYSQNRQKLRKLLNNSYNVPDPVSSTMLGIENYMYDPSNFKDIHRLVQEQIKINKLMTVGKDMLNRDCNCHK
jgi:hypothetical protein